MSEAVNVSPADKPVPPLPGEESPSPARRLSTLIGKAKKSIVEKVSSTESEQPSAPPAEVTEETPAPTAEKRRSLRFDGLFHRGNKTLAKETRESAPEPSAAAVSPPKETVVDQVKRTPIINRFFTKKGETPDATAQGSHFAIIDARDPGHERSAEASTTEHALVRKWTQILRSLPAKKKKVDAEHSNAHHQPEEVHTDQVRPAATSNHSIPVVQATA
ncbi:hypothetical protein BX666DRAFT_1205126 [Dichotomocladium elegans]|nr:hypothetical protein BX666DRAFT_1205126 [Dichotomocladium elegans]